MQRKVTVVDVKWILAGHYLSVVYFEAAKRGHKPINLSVTHAAEWMGHLARGTVAEPWMDKTLLGQPELRLSRAFLGIIWSHGRKPNADDRVDMERLAERFLEEHRTLIAELTLTPADSPKVKA